ncbi:MAG: hypothetical protein GWP05_02175, partial [Anaerolineaceae bacterium]|nr:hypothetical protein [Anaerolineaceae bacterium]
NQMIYRRRKVFVISTSIVLAAVAVWLGACSAAPQQKSPVIEGEQKSPVAEGWQKPRLAPRTPPSPGRQLQPHTPGSSAIVLRPGETEAMIVYSGATHGMIEPCGCDGNIAGGLAKELTVVNWLREEGLPMLYLHPGDLFPYEDLPVKLKFVAEAASHMGYDAIGIGDQEFRGGLDRLRELATQYRLPFLSQNLRDAEGGRIAPGYVIKDLAGLKVGIFSVVGDQWYLFNKDAFPEGIKIEPTREAIAATLREFEGKVDFIVMLSHQDRSIDRKVAREFPRINLIIGGHDEKMITRPIRVGRTLILNAGTSGDYVGVVRLAINPSGDVRVLAHEFGVASGVVPRNKKLAEIYRRYVEESKVQPESYAKDGPDVFESSKTCRPCHTKIYQEFMTTKHAQAWQVLEKVRRTEDRQCWSCHAMGFRRKTGFKSIKETPDLANISCQSCHPVTHDHKDRGIKVDLDFALNQRACERCHNSVRSPDFNYWEAVDKVDHHDVKEKSNQPPPDYKHWRAVPPVKTPATKN